MAAAVDRLAKVLQKFQPGTRWNYGVSTDLLGRVVEVVAGVGSDRFFADHSFAPLGMTEPVSVRRPAPPIALPRVMTMTPKLSCCQ